MTLLDIRDLWVRIPTRDGTDVWPVRGASFHVERGETLALVGESGCGKSMTCLAIAGLLPRRVRVASGRIGFDGTDLTAASPREAHRVRAAGMGSIFQDATNALNPVRPVGWQIAEACRLRAGMTRAEAAVEAVRLLGRVGMPEPEARAREYPHQFSGGMNQRAMIALAIAGNPRLLISDEATTALDVTVQAQVLDLLAALRDDLGVAVIFITHDLGVVAQTADRVAVMYAGRIGEIAPVRDLFADPRHPYADGLLDALPRPDRDTGALRMIEGEVPPLSQLPQGCAFAPRCPRAEARCATAPPLTDEGSRVLACWNPVHREAAA